MPMSRAIASAFIYGAVPHGGTFPEPELDKPIATSGPLSYGSVTAPATEEQLAKIREMFAPMENNE